MRALLKAKDGREEALRESLRDLLIQMGVPASEADEAARQSIEDFYSQTGRGNQSVPGLGKCMMCLMTSAEDREVILGDLEEEFAALVEREGRWEAITYYYRQVLGSFGAFMRAAFLYAPTAWISALIRRLIH